MVGVTGIIEEGRRIDWRDHVGVPGGIPERTQLCATVDATTYGDGATDASAVINAAIADCGADQVVYLPEGTYALASPIDFAQKSHVTLRGAGPGRTVLRP